jgi:hypothetical protein
VPGFNDVGSAVSVIGTELFGPDVVLSTVPSEGETLNHPPPAVAVVNVSTPPPELLTWTCEVTGEPLCNAVILRAGSLTARAGGAGAVTFSVTLIEIVGTPGEVIANCPL